MVHLPRRGFRRSGRAAIHSLVWNAPKKDGHVSRETFLLKRFQIQQYQKEALYLSYIAFS
jgi:hypothetical protein